VNVTFNVNDLISFAGGTNYEAGPANLRTNSSQNGRDDGTSQVKGPTTYGLKDTKRLELH